MANWQSFQGNPFGYLGGRLASVPILGLVLLIVGAVVAFKSDALTEWWFPDRPVLSIRIKLVGLALAILGALRIFY